jgi:hypothetical protein
VGEEIRGFTAAKLGVHERGDRVFPRAGHESTLSHALAADTRRDSNVDFAALSPGLSLDGEPRRLRLLPPFVPQPTLRRSRRRIAKTSFGSCLRVSGVSRRAASGNRQMEVRMSRHANRVSHARERGSISRASLSLGLCLARKHARPYPAASVT